MTHHIASVLASISIASVFMSTAAILQTAKDIEGAWTLVSTDDVRPDGSRKPLYGAKPAGLLIFLPNGTYSLQNMNTTEQKKFASGDRANGTPEEYKAAVLASNPHWGKWKVNPADQTLTFQIEYALFPNWAGTTQVRKFTLRGDELGSGLIDPR
jgi:hypothetical protein